MLGLGLRLEPRAASRLESLGFSDVYDYTEGKLDWLAAGLPTEGTNASLPRAGDVARQDVPTCGTDEVIGEVRERVAAAGWNACVVVNEAIRDVRERVVAAGWNACVVVNEKGVVFGLLRAEELAKGNDDPVEAVMRPGPSTFRPHVPIEEMAHYMVHDELASSPITTSDGRLVGLLVVEDAARAAHDRHWPTTRPSRGDSHHAMGSGVL